MIVRYQGATREIRFEDHSVTIPDYGGINLWSPMCFHLLDGICVCVWLSAHVCVSLRVYNWVFI